MSTGVRHSGNAAPDVASSIDIWEIGLSNAPFWHGPRFSVNHNISLMSREPRHLTASCARRMQ
jgi:hypothetical protein